MPKEKVVKDKPNRQQRKKQKTLFSLYVYVFIFILLLIVYFWSPFSYVSDIKVNGNVNVSVEQIIKLSGITSESRIWPNNFEEKEKLIKEHVEIEEVDIQRRFPNHIEINVKEYQWIGYLLDGHKVYPVLRNGTVLRREVKESLPDLPLLVSWEEGEELELMAQELSITSAEALGMISEIHHNPTELNPLRLSVYMTNGYEVIGTIPDFALKISDYPTVATKIPKEVIGVIDMEVGFVLKPYESEEEEEENEKEKE